MEDIIYGLFIIVILLSIFFISSALIMVTYNNSIVKMNPLWKKIEYTDAIVFTLFLMFAGSAFSPNFSSYNSYKGNL